MKKEIYIIEDDHFTGFVTSKLLKYAFPEHQIKLFLTGEDALKEIQQNAHNLPQIEFILSDFELPGMNGLETIQRLQHFQMRNQASKENSPNFYLISASFHHLKSQLSHIPVGSISINAIYEKPLNASIIDNIKQLNYTKTG